MLASVSTTKSNHTNTSMGDVSALYGEMNKILQKVEDRVFTGSVRVHDVFKSFDVDNDGERMVGRSG